MPRASEPIRRVRRPDLAMRLIGGTQGSDCAVPVPGKNDLRDIGHLAHQGLAEGRILLGLPVFSILPGTGGGDDRDGQPAWRSAGLAQVAGEDQLLADCTQHLR